MKSFFRSPTKREQYTLIAIDCVAIILALFLTLTIQLLSQENLGKVFVALGSLPIFSKLLAYANLVLVFSLASLLISSIYVFFAYIFGVYEIDAEFSFIRKTPLILISLLLAVIVRFFILKFFHIGNLSGFSKLYFVVIALCLLLFLRFIYYHFLKKKSLYRILILNRDPLANKSIEDLLAGNGKRYFSVDYRDLDGVLQLDDPKYNLVVYPFSTEIPKDDLISILKAKFKGISTCNSLTFYVLCTGRFPAFDIDPRWFLDLSVSLNLARSMQKRIKRAVDITLSLAGLILSLPLMVIIAMLVKRSSPGPVLFTHERLGLHEKPFLIYKFRTMVQDAETKSGPVWAQKADPRVTPLGMILRKTRMDELPQLFNVLRGDMSFVGPRPIRKFFADKLAQQFPFYFMRFYIKPGLTGWAQVSGGYGEDVEGQLVKLEYELFYLQEYTLFLDALIILKTIKKVLWAQGQ